MTQTTVVNVKEAKYDVYIGRAGQGKDGYFGNPIVRQSGSPRGSTLQAYKKHFYMRLNNDPEFKKRVHALKGKVLGCHCKPHPCHGDVIAHYLNTI